MKTKASYVALAVISSVAMSYVLRLSAADRGVVDWIVIGAIASAILWSVWALGHRLRDGGGGKAVWHESRTLLFWSVGLMNTVWARPGARGTWKWWVGVVLLVLAAGDTVALYRKERQAMADSA